MKQAACRLQTETESRPNHTDESSVAGFVVVLYVQAPSGLWQPLAQHSKSLASHWKVTISMTAITIVPSTPIGCVSTWPMKMIGARTTTARAIKGPVQIS